MEMLELPNGETVTPEDVFLFGGYPYRFVPGDDDAAFYLSPLYWGGGEMDIPFDGRDQLVDQWGEAGRAEGPLSESEWEDWLIEARRREQFDEAELDAVAREVGVDRGGLLARLLGRFR